MGSSRGGERWTRAWQALLPGVALVAWELWQRGRPLHGAGMRPLPLGGPALLYIDAGTKHTHTHGVAGTAGR